MSLTEEAHNLLAKTDTALKSTDERAFLVPPRILRRVIREDRALAGLVWQVPHRKSFVIERDELLWHVGRDELGLPPYSELPPRVMLISHPEPQTLAKMSLADLLLRTWRLLFHARVHLALEEQLAEGTLTPAGVRQRVDRIGQVEFDEGRAVLSREHFLFPQAGYEESYVEFAAVFLELRRFAPDWIGTYFPSIEEPGQVAGILGRDVDVDSLFETTRLNGAPGPAGTEPSAGPGPPEPKDIESPRETLNRDPPHPRYHDRLVRRAEKAAARGNSVRAAVLYRLAASYAAPAQEAAADAAARAELTRLVGRLQTALGFDEAEASLWEEGLDGLLSNSTRGFWNADRRLLYDLQKVCVDHERPVSAVDLAGWMLSRGRRPIRRTLPNQREVLVSKHLRTATGRLKTVKLAGRDYQRLSELLHSASRSAETQLRNRLRPEIARALEDVGLQPDNLPERAAWRKLIEELLDCIVQRGFLTMSNLRDAVSRNSLKLADVDKPGTLWTGDALLRANRRLGEVLDGVYRRGEFYLRGLQRLGSVSFGTPPGRFLMQFVVIPFGGALVILEALDHLLHLVSHAEFTIRNPYSLAAVGGFLLGVIHARPFRAFVVELVRQVSLAVRGLVYDLPAWLVNRRLVHGLIHSRPVALFRRHLIMPLGLTAVFWGLLPEWNVYPRFEFPWAVSLFLALTMIHNSRLGRDFEEVTAERIIHTWQQIRARIFVALFEAVMTFFKRVLEGIERVLYAVDEWLRFRSGETRLVLGVKAVTGLGWAAVAYVVRFCVTLLIEPQINPIKHFPVVTVSHKIILPTQPLLAGILTPPLDTVTANALAAVTVTVLPGVFGFLVWELKENWRLYAANRPRELRPVIVGRHGETLIRLMKPGFHSGTLPKLYGKLRRVTRKERSTGADDLKEKYSERLHHLETSLRQFIERELLTLLAANRMWRDVPVGTPERDREDGGLTVGTIQLASNNARIELRWPALSEESLWLAFQEQSGWLVAGVLQPGWLTELPPEKRDVLRLALAGFYKRGGVDLVREQIEGCFDPDRPPYDIDGRGLVVWPDAHYEVEIVYNLHQRPALKPRPVSAARSFNLPRMNAKQVLYTELPIAWSRWVAAWDAEEAGRPIPPVFPDERPRLLPVCEPDAASERSDSGRDAMRTFAGE